MTGSVGEEPQEARGAPGSRDTGADEPAAGPSGRPAGRTESDTEVSADRDTVDRDMPDLPTGDGGG
jgi:hypothetical protein